MLVTHVIIPKCDLREVEELLPENEKKDDEFDALERLQTVFVTHSQVSREERKKKLTYSW